ncbi:hypothetical protein BDZ88DRAFT_312277 [Geranomyces variabilis]|nr:hypothetical protein BDZ88DRAFT_312277 [Geranomyces variabilis]KAJ3131909.1 hypothetical protein HDU90_007656 [Geranomyces variabilis]
MPPPAKHMKRQKQTPAAKEPSKPTTAEEAVEEALALEDKGDRYASGPKAVRFYQRACEMYAHAHALDPADLDVPYNWGRLLLILAEFSEPEFEPKEKYELFKDAAGRLRSGDTHNADCQFNLAQALRGLAEVALEETDVGAGQREAVAALTEAEAVLAAVYQLQKTASEMPPLKRANEAETPEDPAESHVATLIDTLSAHAQTLTMLFREVAEPEASILYERAQQKLAEAQGILDSASSEMLSADDKIQLQIDVYVRCAEVLAARADVAAQVAHRVDSETFELAVEKLSRALDLAEGKNVEALCEKGDVLCSWSDAVKTANGGLDKILSAEQPSAAEGEGCSSSSSSANPNPTPSPISTLRALYARAVEAYTAAYTIEQSTANIATTLGNTHLLRVPLYSASPDERLILAKNAEKYYRRAAALGDRSILMALAKALSWSGQEAECKKVLVAWTKHGQEAEGDETAEVGFAAIVAQWVWFDAAIAGQM